MSLVRQPDQAANEHVPRARFGPVLRRPVRRPDHPTPEPPVLRALVRERDQKPPGLRMLDRAMDQPSAGAGSGSRFARGPVHSSAEGSSGRQFPTDLRRLARPAVRRGGRA